jgi:ATP/maltotriose-dependent transcriptional regulator MalT
MQPAAEGAIRTIAKIQPPSATGLVPRPRLFAMLEKSTNGRMTWITAPGGSGKTSLLATWLEASGKQAVWLRLGAGDNDTAALFHYLTRAVQLLCEQQEPAIEIVLPVFTPEAFVDLALFGRRFFERLGAALPLPAVIVFDDYQEVAHDSPLHLVLEAALDYLPPAVTVMCVSRQPPPAPFARRSTHAEFTWLNWEDLQLTDDEARAICVAHGLDQEQASALLPQVKGWAAGLMLTLRARFYGMPTKRFGGAPMAIDYFLQEIYGVLPAARRSIILRCVLPPRIPAGLASQLAGNAAIAYLDELFTNGIFTHRRISSNHEPEYEFHQMYREFLLGRARLELTAEESDRLLATSARYFEGQGRHEEALESWCDSGAWSEVTRLVCELGSQFMRQGQMQTIEAVIARVDPDFREHSAWLNYWQGRAIALRNHPAAANNLERAYALFSELDDPVGALLCCAEIIGVHESAGIDFTPCTVWARRIEKWYPQAADHLGPGLEAHILGRCALFVYGPMEGKLVDFLLQRADLVMASCTDPTARASLSRFTSFTDVLRGEAGDAHGAIQLANAMGNPTTISAYLEMINASFAWNMAHWEEASAIVTRSLDVAERNGNHVYAGFLAASASYAALSMGHLEKAARSITKTRALVAPQRAIDHAQCNALSAILLCMRGETHKGIATMQQAAARTQVLGAYFLSTSCRNWLAQMLSAVGRTDEARAECDLALDQGRKMGASLLIYGSHWVRAFSHLCDAQEALALISLREALSIAARFNYFTHNPPLWMPQAESQLLALALAHEIEPDYVRRFILQRNLKPPNPDTPGWPWPIRVYSLGRFEIVYGGQAPAASRKKPQRVLDLLKAMIALGCIDIPAVQLADALWPELDGAAANDALEVTLHRLRKLLGRDDAVLASGGTRSLNCEVVWIDASVFARLAESIKASRVNGDDAIAKALRIYGGGFLPGEDAKWVGACRDRLSARFEDVVLRAIQRRTPSAALAILNSAAVLDPGGKCLQCKIMDLQR